jgi:hypothetical protein
MTYNEIINFSFSIPNQPPGQAEQELSQLLQKMMAAKIRLRGLSGFASGRRIKIFCVPRDANKFRDFMKSERIRLREQNGFAITGEVKAERVLAILDFIALSGFNVRAFDVLSTGRKSGGFVW